MSNYLLCCIYLHTVPLACNCGRRGTPDFDRIVGGTFATNAEYPWAVKIRGCGAALISEQWVVTAAHCVGSDNTIDVWLGVHSLSDNYNEVILRIRRLNGIFSNIKVPVHLPGVGTSHPAPRVQLQHQEQ